MIESTPFVNTWKFEILSGIGESLATFVKGLQRERAAYL